MKPYTLEMQMARLGIPETENGPYVTELRVLVARKLANGMVYMSAGMAEEGFYGLPFEEQAKARLAFDWAIQRRHAYRIKVIDPIAYWSTNTRTMKRHYIVRWRRIFPWIGDRFRELGSKYRVWKDRNLVNPYLSPQK